MSMFAAAQQMESWKGRKAVYRKCFVVYFANYLRFVFQAM